jgi:hypothetical protein
VTGADLAKAALELIGAYSSADGDVPPADQETALRHANLMRKSWNAHDMALYAIERQSFAWTSGQASRTIGAAGQLVGTYPLQILAAKLIPVGQTSEVHVHVMTEREYADIPNKAQTATYFTDLRFERTAAEVGTITVWPVPQSAPTLLLHNKVRLGAIVADTDIVAMEEAEAAMVSSLAKRLAVIFGKPWTEAQQDIARTDWATLQRANLRVPDEKGMPAGFPGVRGGVSDTQFDSGHF